MRLQLEVQATKVDCDNSASCFELRARLGYYHIYTNSKGTEDVRAQTEESQTAGEGGRGRVK